MMDFNFRNVSGLILIAASCITLGCSSEAAPPDLNVAIASAVISQAWARDELSHFKVAFHSDTVIECGVKNDLWKLVETTERGYTWAAYQLTEKGSKVLFAIDLKDSGKLHEITVRGPYRFEILGITPGSQPDTRNVEFRWEIDWSKASADLHACVPRFELSGHEVALFRLSGLNWRLVGYLKPEDVPTPDASPVVEKLP